MKETVRSFIAFCVSRVPRGILTDDRFFELYQSRGWHATPTHFYQPVPDTRELSTNLWEAPSELVGIDCRIDFQSRLLERFAERFIPEFHEIPESPVRKPGEYTRDSGFSGLDGAFLYSMIREYRPGRIIEIGSGYSTLLAILALRRNAQEQVGEPGRITAIEPYPKDFLRPSLEGVGELLQERVENVPLSEFAKLRENDVLFIDSSHTVKIGGDVVYEILEIIPRLAKGVLVHFHDIFLPLEYPRDWVMDRHTFWSEQYLLQAFLAFNTHFEMLWSAGCMHVHYPDQLQSTFPYYEHDKQSAGSLWIRKCK